MQQIQGRCESNVIDKVRISSSMSANTLEVGQTRVTLKASDAATKEVEKNAAKKEARLFQALTLMLISLVLVLFVYRRAS